MREARIAIAWNKLLIAHLQTNCLNKLGLDIGTGIQRLERRIPRSNFYFIKIVDNSKKTTYFKNIQAFIDN